MAAPLSHTQPRAIGSAETQAPAPPIAPARRKPSAAMLAGLFALVLVAWALRQYLGSRNRVSTDNAQIEGHVTPVAARIQAFVSEVRVDDNQPVRLGDTLVVLDRRDLEVKLHQAEADLAAAQAGYGKGGGQAAAQLSASQAQAASMQSSIAAAEANFRNGERYYTYRLVASQRVDGKPRQMTLLNLGRHFAVDQDLWASLCVRIEQLLSHQVGAIAYRIAGSR